MKVSKFNISIYTRGKYFVLKAGIQPLLGIKARCQSVLLGFKIEYIYIY